ncbi:hypothetical protein GCM10012289_28880 [Nonomuraea cavernae]|uniref:Uncharacterized protein n=1 Tax=Nonomuraea cavernae TaxID=2045107 RepID=A0A917YXW0_9ACTN|nr:hypothetical protein GCM10012289_28880 [Nonomuraea cavernae]
MTGREISLVAGWGFFVLSGFSALNVTSNPRDLAVCLVFALTGLGSMVGAVALGLNERGQTREAGGGSADIDPGLDPRTGAQDGS